MSIFTLEMRYGISCQRVERRTTKFTLSMLAATDKSCGLLAGHLMKWRDCTLYVGRQRRRESFHIWS